MRRTGDLKPPKERKTKSIWVAVVTAVFLVAGVIFAVIGYRNEILHWMGTTGLALLALASIPILVFSYKWIQKKITN